MLRSDTTKRTPYFDSRGILNQGKPFPLRGSREQEVFSQPSSVETRVNTFQGLSRIPLSSLLQERPFPGNAYVVKTTTKANSKRFLLPSIKANSFQIKQDESTSIMQSRDRQSRDVSESKNLKDNQTSEVEVHPPSTGTASTTSSSSSQSKRFRIKSGSLLKKPPSNINMSGNKSVQPSPLKPKSTKNDRQHIVEGESNNNLDFKCCELSRMCLNLSSQSRAKLPLLIIHFEGIIGTCLIQNKERSKENHFNPKNNSGHLFIRKDVKNELKHLSRNFLIVLVFPFLDLKYKEVIKYFINNKYCFDGAYYRIGGDTANRSHLSKISENVLDYNMITADFKIKNINSSNKKAIVLLPLNLSLQRIKNELQSEEQLLNYEKPSFLYFFPKIKIKSENLRIICVPNFLLDDRNEQYNQLYQTEFAPISKLAQLVVKEFKETNISTAELEAEDIPRESLESDINGLKKLDLQRVISEIEKAKSFGNKLKKIQKLKQDKKNQTTVINPIDTAQVIQRIVEHLKSKSSELLDSDTVNISNLIQSNNPLFKLYERDVFYSNKNCHPDVVEITKFLENPDIQIEKENLHQKEHFKNISEDRNVLTCQDENQLNETDGDLPKISPRILKKKRHVTCNTNNTIPNEGDEIDEITFLKQISSKIWLYLEE